MARVSCYGCPMTSKTRATPFVTVAVSERAREALRAGTVWAITCAGLKLSGGDALIAAFRVAMRHPDEMTAEIQKLKAEPQK